MVRRPLVLAAAMSILTACAGSAVRDASESTHAPTVSFTTAASSTPSSITPGPALRGNRVELPPLPAQGVVIDTDKGVRFIDLTGRVVARLPGWDLYYTWTIPGPVVLRSRPHVFFVLHAVAHTVVPIGDAPEAVRVGQQFEDGFGPEENPGLPYPRGSRVEGHPGLRDGFWAYALPSPNGSRLLAQWSGECEVPNAFFIDGDSVVTVDGYSHLGPASDSSALGWTNDGRAVVTLAGGACSMQFPRPGVYLLDGPGEGDLLVPGMHAARMWNPA
jgi:hypothetical protein